MSDVESRCSVACTRSGFFALIFALLGLWLLTPMNSQVKFNALAKYILARDTLKTHLEQIEKDPCWNLMVREAKKPEMLVLSQLLSYPCEMDQRFSSTTPAPPNAQPTAPADAVQSTSDSPPGKPRGLTLTVKYKYTLGEYYPIQEGLEGLNNPDLIRLAKDAHFDDAMQIYRWEMRRFQMSRAGRLQTTEEIKELASHEFPNFEKTMATLQGNLFLATPWAPIKLTPDRAATLIELWIFLSVTYFWLFYLEARQSTSFPSPGTLFSVLLKREPSGLLFPLLLAIPAISAVLIAYSSVTLQLEAYAVHLGPDAGTWGGEPLINSVLAVLVVVFCISIQSANFVKKHPSL